MFVSLNDEGVTGFCLERIGIHDIFVEHGPQEFLRKKYQIDASAIVNTAKKMVEGLRIGELRDCELRN